MSFRTAFPCLARLADLAADYRERGLRLRSITLTARDFRDLLNDLPPHEYCYPLVIAGVTVRQQARAQ